MVQTTTTSKIPKNWIQVNKIRRGRGYSWEHEMVIDINKISAWKCRRLGGSSAGLPDLIAVNNQESKLLVFECKATKQAKVLYVPEKEIRRCFAIVDMFSIYGDRTVVVSFKFGRPHNNEYHFIVDDRCYDLMDRFVKLMCTVKGECIFYYVSNETIHDEFGLKIGKELIKTIKLDPFYLYGYSVGANVSIETEPKDTTSKKSN